MRADIPLAKISVDIQKIKPYEHTRSFLGSSSGNYVSNVDPEKLTKYLNLDFQDDRSFVGLFLWVLLIAFVSGQISKEIQNLTQRLDASTDYVNSAIA